MFDLQLPLTRKPWTTLSNPCNKVRGKNILLKKSSCVCLSLRTYHCVCLFIVSLWYGTWEYNNFSLSFIASGRSLGLHPISSHSCWIYVCAGRPAFVRPCVGVHRSTSLMSSSLLLQQCSACLVHLTWIVFVMGGSWPYSWCFVGCCRQDLFNIAIM